MDIFDLAWRIVENQGILALILALTMYQNAKERSAILKKNCELNHFIMKVLQQKIDEDSPLRGSAQGFTGPQKPGFYGNQGNMTSPDHKVDPGGSQKATEPIN